MDRALLVEALELLGNVLADRGLSFHIATIGASALLLSGEGRHSTGDVDVVAVGTADRELVSMWTLPAELAAAAGAVAEHLGLRQDWLNAGAVGVLQHRLPTGFEQRLRSRVYGNLVVSALSRVDLLRLKLLAAADEGPDSRHVRDVRGMEPAQDELAAALGWAREQLHPSAHTLDDVARALGVEG